MIAVPVACVVDASLGVKLVVNEPDSSKAQQLLAHLPDPATKIHVPELFFLECANAFWKLVQRKNLSAAMAIQHFQQIKTCALQVSSIIPFADEALNIALQFGATVYDS